MLKKILLTLIIIMSGVSALAGENFLNSLIARGPVPSCVAQTSTLATTSSLNWTVWLQCFDKIFCAKVKPILNPFSDVWKYYIKKENVSQEIK